MLLDLTASDHENNRDRDSQQVAVLSLDPWYF